MELGPSLQGIFEKLTDLTVPSPGQFHYIVKFFVSMPDANFYLRPILPILF